MKKSDGWKRDAGKRLSRRRLLRDAAGMGFALATLGLMGCEEQRQATPTQVLAPRVSEMLPIPLPVAPLLGELSLEEAISNRRSRREFRDSPLTLEQVSQILLGCSRRHRRRGTQGRLLSRSALPPGSLPCRGSPGRRGIGGGRIPLRPPEPRPAAHPKGRRA
jgi:hypothetical protein